MTRQEYINGAHAEYMQKVPQGYKFNAPKSSSPKRIANLLLLTAKFLADANYQMADKITRRIIKAYEC